MNLNLFARIPEKDSFKRRSDAILRIRQAKYPELHPLFVKWATYLPYAESARKAVNDAFFRCEPFLDSVFPDRFPTKNEFNQRLWELFLCDFLICRGFHLDSTIKELGTPDLCVEFDGKRIWIELTHPDRHRSIEEL